MASESDRIARAGDYVLGLMHDAERERAERDLEIDPAFRDAVVQLAERMHVFDRAEPAGEERWTQITQRIADLPQMRTSGLSDARGLQQ
jgi:anti-sigma-K factor RskA